MTLGRSSPLNQVPLGFSGEMATLPVAFVLSLVECKCFVAQQSPEPWDGGEVNGVVGGVWEEAFQGGERA